MRVAIWKSDGSLHEMLRDAEPGKMLARAEASGISPDLLEEIELTPEEYKARFDTISMDPNALLAMSVRQDRDARIQAVRWRIERHQDEILLGLTPTEPLEPIARYIQALRDITKQDGFPGSITWPELPGGA